jgi:Bacterial Ig domain/Putative Ig domain
MYCLKSNNRLMTRLAATAALAVLASLPAGAAEPVVKTARWVASDPSIPHDTFAYRSITLKGTSSIAGQNIRATWDFGDNTDPATFTVVNGYDVSARHVYYATPGTMFTARLTVVDTETGESGSATYLVAMREKTLDVEVNVAIDEGLWHVHKSMQQDSANASNLLAFERNGHLESGDSANPYTETVARGLNALRQVKSPTPDMAAALAAASGGLVRAQTDALQAPLAKGAVSDISGLLTLLQLTAPAVQLPDWYSAEVAKGDPTDGIARTLVNRQQDDGSWAGHSSDPALETSASLRVLSASPRVNVLSSTVTNVNSQVSMTATGVQRCGANFCSTRTVTNTSGSTITGPLSIGLSNLTAGASLFNASGTFNGDPYINLPAGDLTAGSSTSVLLRFSKPTNNPILFNYTATVYSGTMPPSALSVTCPANTATTGTPYNSAYTASGGVLAYTFSTPAGMLPHNLTLDPATGAVTGTPDMVQNPTFTAQVTDSAGGTPETASDATCHINVTSANQPPTAVAQSTTTNEDIAKLITLTGTDPDGNALTFTIVTPPSNGMVGPLGVPMCSGNPSTCTATVTYTPNANTSGSDSFTFKVNDGTVDSSPATVSITINFVNDAPSFTKGADQSANKGAGAQTVMGWATAISPGPGSNEAGQTVHFNITGNTTPGIFSVAPAVDASGTLTYTPSASTTGVSTITLNIQDNGGTANGGVDTSAPQTFTITVNDPPKITSLDHATFAPGKTGQSFTVTTTGFPTGASMVIGETGTLPTGVMFTDNHNGTATINGTPASGTQSGSPYPLTLSANNGVPPADSQNFTLNITCPAIAVSGLTPLNLVFNVPAATTYPTVANRTYTQSLGNGTIVWSATGLPTNVTIDSSTGIVSGTPNVTGTFSTTITATDAGGCVGTKAVTVTVAPVAVNDAYTGLVDNTQFVVTGGTTATPGTPTVVTNGNVAFRLTNNDLPSGGITATAGTFATSAGGSVTIAADGTFIYTPKANPTVAAVTSDSFTYTVTSNTGGGAAVTSAPATVMLTLSGRVWYVLNNVAMTGNGQSQNPFKSLAEAVSASTANDFIFVYQGDGTTANLGAAALKTGQSLIGQGVSLLVNGSTLVAAGSTPLIGGTVTLNGSTTARGFNLSTGGTTGMNDPGSPISGVTVNTVSVTTTTGTGVSLSDTVGTLSFTGLTTNGGAGASLTGSNSGATFTFTGVSVSSGANAGFTATGGGTLTITGAANTITSAGGTALNVANTTIGAGGLNFRSISANGDTNGIVLNNTGASGSLTVTGNAGTCTSLASTCTGGTIQNTTSHAINLTSTLSPSFSNMKITNIATSGIFGTGVTNFTLTNSVIDGVNTSHTAADSNVAFNVNSGSATENNLSGTVSITNNTLNNSFQEGISIKSYAGTISNLTITGNSMTSATTTANSASNAIAVEALRNNGGANFATITTGTISGNTITNFPGGAGILVFAGISLNGGSAGGNVGTLANPMIINSNTIAGAGTGAAGMGTNGIQITVGNKSDGFFSIGASGQANNISNVKGNGIAFSKFGDNSGSGTNATKGIIAFNTVNANNTSNSSGINTGADNGVVNTEHPTLYLDIHDNTVSNTTGNGILSTVRSVDGTGVFHIEHNTVNQPIQGTTAEGIRVDAGNGTESSGATVCLKIDTNTTTGGKNGSGSITAPGIGLRQNHATVTSTFNIDGLTPNPASDGGQMEGYVNGQNPGSASGTFGVGGTVSISSGATYHAAACTIP